MKLTIMYYRGLGDALMLNAVLFELGKETGQKVYLGTNVPAIYQGNPHLVMLPFTGSKYQHQIAVLLRTFKVVDEIRYVDYFHSGQQPSKHILEILADEVSLETAPKTPALFLNPKEIHKARLPAKTKPWIAIQSTGLSEWTDNKNWGHQNMARVVQKLRNKFSFVQLGAAADPALDVDLNLCGRVNVRQAVATLVSCQALICQVGFLMHAAAALQIPSVVIYGGFEAPWQSGYAWNENLYNPVECSPCWLTTPCPYEKKCLQEITCDQVCEAVFRIFKNS